MTDVGRHPRIKLMTLSEVEGVSGYVGNFNVKVRKKARYVREDECTACGDCVEVCPVFKPDEYQMGLSSRKAIYMPFPQAVPASYIINMEDCLGDNPIACGKCMEKCEKKCIDFDMQDEIIDLQVGTIIVATGLDSYDPTQLDEYGYTKYENVVTSLEFERLICASGPSEGHFIRPGDGKIPKKIGFVQCVGSRSLKRGNAYCSNVCCMNTVKDSLLLKEHYPDTDIYVFYIDIRAFGKGFEELFNRSKKTGVKYVRGLPGDVREDPETGNLLVRVENTTTGTVDEYDLDLLVLSTGLEPRQDGDGLRQLLSLSRTADGFLAECHPKLMPVDTSTKGIYLAGCAEAPKDIKDSVTQASAAAARAEIVLNTPKLKLDAAKAVVDTDKCTCCEMCVKVCPYGAITTSREKKIPAVVTEAKCTGCGSCAAECPFDAITIRHFEDEEYLAQIESALAERPEEKVLSFACNWCSYAASDLTGSSRLQYPSSPRVIRTMCSARVDKDYVMEAFRQGAPIVLISGCHSVDCHYNGANRATQKRVDRLWDRLERLGIRPERLQLEWMSAAEGQRFAQVMKELEEMRKQVTAEEIAETRRILEEQANKKKKATAKAATAATK
jgi:heterodisulfide reductase subunit A